MILHEDRRKKETSISIKGVFKNVTELSNLQKVINATQDDKNKTHSKVDVICVFINNKFSRK